MHEDKLFALALQCEKCNDENRCAGTGCVSCTYNVFNYVDDVREASLLKANARTVYYNRKEIYEGAKSRLDAYKAAPLLMIAIIVIAIAIGCEKCSVASATDIPMPNEQIFRSSTLQLVMHYDEQQRELLDLFDNSVSCQTSLAFFRANTENALKNAVFYMEVMYV